MTPRGSQVVLVRALAGALAVALAGCAHRPPLDELPPAPGDLGSTHPPFSGRPSYLAARARASDVAPAPLRTGPLVSPLPDAARRDRLRALLAAVDGHLAAMAPAPTEATLDALELSTREVTELLAPFPDALPEAEELRDLAAGYATTKLGDRAKREARMRELVDLIRLQLLAGQ